MKDNQKELQGFFEEYATTEDPDVEGELDELTAQLEKEELGDLPSVKEQKKEPIKKEPEKKVDLKPMKIQNDEQALNDFLEG